jgi:hypothetical protein
VTVHLIPTHPNKLVHCHRNSHRNSQFSSPGLRLHDLREIERGEEQVNLSRGMKVMVRWTDGSW